jgi:DNA-binding MarR family transcriptional regulator
MNREEITQEIIESITRCQRPTNFVLWRKIGLSHAQVGMLFMLFHHQNASVKKISEHLGITKSAITQLMDPLVDKDLVLRQNDPKDRRVVQLSITAKGKKVLKEVNKLKFAGMRSALGSLSDPELEQLAGIYRKMAANKN